MIRTTRRPRPSTNAAAHPTPSKPKPRLEYFPGIRSSGKNQEASARRPANCDHTFPDKSARAPVIPGHRWSRRYFRAKPNLSRSPAAPDARARREAPRPSVPPAVRRRRHKHGDCRNSILLPDTCGRRACLRRVFGAAALPEATDLPGILPKQAEQTTWAPPNCWFAESIPSREGNCSSEQRALGGKGWPANAAKACCLAASPGTANASQPRRPSTNSCPRGAPSKRAKLPSNPLFLRASKAKLRLVIARRGETVSHV